MVLSAMIDEIFLQFTTTIGTAPFFAAFALMFLHAIFFTILDFWI